MAQVAETPLSGQVTIGVRANLRQGAPDRQAPVVRKLDPGAVVDVVALATGEPVQGNAHWYRTAEDDYVWAGACGPLRPTTSAQAPAPGPAGLTHVTPAPLVVDLYHGDGVTSFVEAKASGLLGVIHKASTGETGKDDAYQARRAAASAAGLLWGAYHWGTAAPVDRQVQNFLDCAAPDPTTLVALDFEQTPGNQMTVAAARAFLEQVFAKLGRRPVIYGGDRLKTELGASPDPFFGAHRLWLADYSATPSLPPSWAAYFLWQYTDGSAGPGKKTVPGIPGNRKGGLDCDYFDGTSSGLSARWSG